MAVIVPAPESVWMSFWRRLMWSRDGAINTALFLLCLLAGVGDSVHHLDQGGVLWTALSVLSLVAGGVVLAGIWWRKRWPVGFAVTAVIVGSVSPLGFRVALVGVFTVAVYRRWPTAVIISVASIVQTVIFLVLYRESGVPANAGFTTTVIIALTGWGMFARARRQLVTSLTERAERAEAEVIFGANQARRAERERMAREMHDVLAHRLSLLSVHAGALEFRPDAPPDEIAKAASVIRANAHEALQDLRSVIGVLREGAETAVPDRPQPTLSALPDLIEESRQAGMAVTLVAAAPIHEAPPAVGRSVYRIIQEGLTNARKHAPASPVRVDVGGGRGRGLTVTVTTQWMAPVPGITDRYLKGRPPGSGTGLIGLRERTSLAGGWLDYGPTPGGEFRLRAWLPWPWVDAPATTRSVPAGG